MYVTNDPQLSGIFSKVGKALKKVVKASTKLSLSHALVKKVAPKIYKKTAGKILGTNPPATPAAPIPDVTPPPAVSTMPATGTFPGVAPVMPSIAPLPAAESTAVLAPTSNFGPAPMPAMSLGPAFGPADPAPAAPADDSSSNMPLILGALGVGALFLFMSKKKGR